MIELNQNLLSRSPEETSRRLCLGLLEEARAALGRLERGEDPEALHDFRVALRRLRSLIRAYRPYLKGSARKKLRTRLSALADSTNAARDLEVQLEWLERPGTELDPEAASAASYLSERLRSRSGELPSPEALRKEFDPLRKSLWKSLSRSKLRLDEGASFVSATGELLAESASRLKESVEAIHSAEDADGLHRARIEAKRFRYLLEPISGELPSARALVQEMKALQDALGELQDVRVLSQSIAAVLESAAIEEAHRLRDLALQEGAVATPAPPPHPGLLSLLRAQRERRERRYLALQKGWLSGASALFFEKVHRLALRLAALSQPPKPRRRFLLTEVPERAKREPRAIVRQAFFPGRKIREHLESIEAGERTRYFRVAVSNETRAEERVSKEAFERFWSSAAYRLERARYRLREDGRTIWIDEVREPDVVLAEAEDDIPKWLEPFIKREVTDSRRYQWETLARRRLSGRARSVPEKPAGPRAGAR